MTAIPITIKPEGEVDLAVVPALSNEVRRALNDGATHITFDLAAVTFMDSAALGVVIGASRECDVRVMNPTPHIRRSFEITGIDDLIGEGP